MATTRTCAHCCERGLTNSSHFTHAADPADHRARAATVIVLVMFLIGTFEPIGNVPLGEVAFKHWKKTVADDTMSRKPIIICEIVFIRDKQGRVRNSTVRDAHNTCRRQQHR